jgi:hypothetical protein
MNFSRKDAKAQRIPRKPAELGLTAKREAASLRLCVTPIARSHGSFVGSLFAGAHGIRN